MNRRREDAGKILKMYISNILTMEDYGLAQMEKVCRVKKPTYLKETEKLAGLGGETLKSDIRRREHKKLNLC